MTLIVLDQVSQVQKGNEKKKKEEVADSKIPEPEQAGATAKDAAKDTGNVQKYPSL